MNQVHKENLTSVENALPNRQGLDIEIFGMEGVPEDILQQHNQRIIQNFYTAQAERQAATGNPPRGQSGGQGPTKKIKYETPEELKKRLAEHRAKVKAGGVVTPAAAPVDGQSPAQAVSSILDLPTTYTSYLDLTVIRRHPSPNRKQASPTPRPACPHTLPAPLRHHTRRQQRGRTHPAPLRLPARQAAHSPCRPDRPRGLHRLAQLAVRRPTSTMAPPAVSLPELVVRRRWTSWWRTRRDSRVVWAWAAMISIS